MNTYKRVSFVGIVLFIFGIIIAIYGFSFLTEDNKLGENGETVKGKVIDIRKKAIYRSPIVSFTTKEGKTYTFVSRMEVNVDLFDYKIGQEVDVIYDKTNPTNAQIDAFLERNFPQLFLGGFGAFLMLFGLIFRWIFIRKAKKYIRQ